MHFAKSFDIDLKNDAMSMYRCSLISVRYLILNMVKLSSSYDLWYFLHGDEQDKTIPNMKTSMVAAQISQKILDLYQTIGVVSTYKM